MLFKDNAAFRWLQPTHFTNRKLTRWALQIWAFDFEISRVSGAENEVADSLFRCPVGPNTIDEESLDVDIHDSPVIWLGLRIKQYREIQPKKDDRNVKLQDIQEWQ